MAYNKRNWKARQGTGLNFFSIDGATPVPIVNQPTTLTEAGDALSAGNLNDWEQRIADGFDSASGELADAVEELESEDTALRSAINANSNRITNLEQKAGDYSVVQYRGTNAVPTGKAKYGLVKSIVGKTRAWNQLVKNGNFADTSNWNGYNAVFSVADNIGKFTASASGGCIVQSVPLINGHKYLRAITLKQTTATADIVCKIGGAYSLSFEASTSWQTKVDIFTSVNNGPLNFTINDGRSGGWDEIQVKNIIFRDLTLIFGSGNEPSTVADALAQLPALGQYNAYDAGSLVDTEVSGVKSVGVNIWDEETKQGYYNSSGSYQSANNRLCTKNMIKVIPSTDYYVKLPLSQSLTDNFIICYDANGNFIERLSKTNSGSGFYFTTPANAFFINMNFTTYYTGGTTYNHDIQICLNSYADKTTYHPYKTDTLSLPETVTLRSAGSVAEVLDVETGKKTRPIGTVDLGDFNWYKASNGLMDYFESLTGISDCVSYYGDGYVVPDFTCGMFTPNNQSNFLATPNNICQQVYSTGNKILVSAPVGKYADAAAFKTAMTGVKLNYPLATPLSDEQVCDPIIDNTIEVQADGTINTIQTQTPVIDNCLDVGYLAV